MGSASPQTAVVPPRNAEDGTIAIDLRHFRYFLAVFEELHFGRAAERLHLAQPPLSRTIRQLEDELGVQLFRRTSRSVTPTEAGQVFAEHARRAIASYNLAIAVARRAGGAEYLLRIGCVPYLGVDQLQRFLAAVRERLPRVRTELSDLLTLPQITRLRAGELDLGIMLWIGEQPDLEAQTLFKGQDFSLLLSPDHPLIAKDVIRPADLQGETLVMFGQSASPAVHDAYLARCAAAGYRFQGVVDIPGENLRDLVLEVARGRGVALGPAWASQGSGERPVVVARPIEPPISQFDHVVAWRRNSPTELRAVIEAVREVAVELLADQRPIP